jgi:hypothetical protein
VIAISVVQQIHGRSFASILVIVADPITPNVQNDCQKSLSHMEIPHSMVSINFPNTAGVANASPIWIRQPISNQNDYYSEKYKAHCTKTSVLTTADGECVHTRCRAGDQHRPLRLFSNQLQATLAWEGLSQQNILYIPIVIL